MKTQIKDPLISPADFAEQALGDRSLVAKINYMRWKGTGPEFVKIGRAIRYRQSDVDTYIEQNTFKTPSVRVTDERKAKAKASA